MIRLPSRGLAGVALIGERDLNRASGDFLRFLGQHCILRPFLLVRGGYLQSQQFPSVSTAACTFDPFFFLAPS